MDSTKPKDNYTLDGGKELLLGCYAFFNQIPVESFKIRYWNGMEWNGMEWNEMEWNGMDHSKEFLPAIFSVIVCYDELKAAGS